MTLAMPVPSLDKGEGNQWRNPHWSIPVNEQVALWTEQVALPSE